MEFSSNSSTMSMSSKSSESLRSPPVCLDLYGRRRQLVKVQVIEREIGIVEEELKSLEGLQPASSCCKELDEFVESRPDPLLALNLETARSHYFWSKFWKKFSFGFRPSCCFCEPWLCLENAICRKSCFSGKSYSPSCSRCCSETKPCLKGCKCSKLPCLPHAQCKFGFSHRRAKVMLCSCCTNICCNSCFLYY